MCSDCHPACSDETYRVYSIKYARNHSFASFAHVCFAKQTFRSAIVMSALSLGCPLRTKNRTLRHLLPATELKNGKGPPHHYATRVTIPFHGSPDATPRLGPVPATNSQTFLRSLSPMKAWASVTPILAAPSCLLISLSPSVHWKQVLAGSAGHSFATQIGSQQFAHQCRSDCTLGFGMSATR